MNQKPDAEPGVPASGSLLQQLQHAESRYQSLFGFNPDPVYVLDLEGRILSGNAALEKLAGQPLSQLLLKPLSSILVPEDREHAERHFRRAVGGVAQVYEVAGMAGEGREFSLVLSTFPLYEDGVITGVYGIARDVTEQKDAERALRDSEERYRLLADSVHDMISLHDLEGRFLYASPSSVSLLGYHPVELIGRSVYDLVVAPDQPMLREAHRDILARQGGPPARFRARRADGTLVWVESTAHLTPETSAGERRIVGVTRDVSERRALEQRLLQSEKMEAVGRLAAGIAHDFNNLLTVVIGRAQIALAGLKGQRGSDDLEAALDAARRASDLVNQLMTFGRTPLTTPRTIDLNAVILDLHPMVNRLLREDIRLVTQLDPQLWAVRADPAQMQQVLVNLVVNSRDAMPQGGTLGITTENLTLLQPPPGLPDLAAGEYALLTVIDTGVGMSEETAEHIFEPFFSSKAHGEGTGLGLATAYSIVRGCGGHIAVESAPGAGAAFRIYLPRTHAPAEPVTTIAVPVADLSGTETVLLVEDDGGVRALVQAVLERYGYRVLCAAGGAEGVRLFEGSSTRVALLIADVVMPGMRGPDLATLLRQRQPDLPVLYISGYNEEAVRRHGVPTSGDYLPKPFPAEVLARRVRSILDANATPAAR